MKKIPLTRGAVALVDDVDFDWLVRFAWRWDGRYAVRSIAKVGGGNTTVYMHREILATNKQADHIDGNGLNNQRTNLRPCTQSQNMGNQRRRTVMESKYKGVRRYFHYGWRAAIGIGGRKRHLGVFAIEEHAAMAYDAAARETFGEFARLNFPRVGEQAAGVDDLSKLEEAEIA